MQHPEFYPALGSRVWVTGVYRWAGRVEGGPKLTPGQWWIVPEASTMSGQSGAPPGQTSGKWVPWQHLAHRNAKNIGAAARPIDLASNNKAAPTAKAQGQGSAKPSRTKNAKNKA